MKWVSPSGRGGVRAVPPAPECDAGPDEFHDSERPRALEEAVGGGRQARSREGKDEWRRAIFERVEDEHRRHGERAECRKAVHGASLSVRLGATGSASDKAQTDRPPEPGYDVQVARRRRTRLPSKEKTR